MSETTNFDSVLVNFHRSANRIQHTLWVMDNHASRLLQMTTPSNGQLSESQKNNLDEFVNEISIIITSLFERLVINLYSILETHAEFKQNYLEKENLVSLEECLSDCWNNVYDNDELIRKWRNLIIAHGKTWNKDEIFAVSYITTDTNEASRKIYLAARCAVYYCQFLLQNIQNYPNALTVFQKKHRDVKQANVFDYLEMKPKAKKVKDSTIQKLSAKGFKNELKEISTS